MSSTNPITGVPSAYSLMKDNRGDMHLLVTVTVAAGTGEAPETAGVHVYQIPIENRVS